MKKSSKTFFRFIRSNHTLFILFLMSAWIANAQEVHQVYLHKSDTLSNAAKVWHLKNSTQLVILLPQYGGTNNSYNKSKLPIYLNAKGIDFAVLFPGFTGYQDIADLKRLDSLIVLVVNKFNYQKNKIVLGGFSAGGYGALRYTLFKMKGEHNLSILPTAVFSVDAPMDLERWYNGMDIFLKRVKPDSTNLFYGEINFLHGMLHELNGGSPEQMPQSYRDRSIVSAVLPDGGNARYFTNLPIRLYTEPDMNYYIEFGIDYNTTNAMDQVAMANILKLQGNMNVSLVLTSGKGYRPDQGNMRMPHSWSIVDEKELAVWLEKYLK